MIAELEHAPVRSSTLILEMEDLPNNIFSISLSSVDKLKYYLEVIDVEYIQNTKNEYLIRYF